MSSDTIAIPKSTLKMFAVVIVAALLGSSVGTFLGSGTTGGNEVAVLPTPTLTAPSPQTAPTPPPPTTGGTLNLAGSAVKGDPNAAISIVEFSDFQCPFCRRFYDSALPEIQANYVDTGEVNFYYKHFPLSFHPAAQPSAEGFECARDQGKEWEFHDKIFDEQGKQGGATVQYTVDDIKTWAAQIPGLDSGTFNSCLDSGKYRQKIQADFTEGQTNGISGTPGFLIGSNEKGWSRVVGAQPYSVFASIIDSLLA